MSYSRDQLDSIHLRAFAVTMELVELVTLFHSLRECADLETLRATVGRLEPFASAASPASTSDLHTLSLALVEARQRIIQDEHASNLEACVRDRLLASTQLSLTLANVLDVLLPAMGAEGGALIMEDGSAHRRNRVLACVGLHHWMGLERDLATSVADYTSERMIVPFRVSSDRYAAIEVLAGAGSTFLPAHATLCARAVSLVQPWLSGIVEAGRANGPQSGALLDADSFQARAMAEFDRASRFRSGVGLMVIDTAGGLHDRHALVLGPLVHHVRRHLRAKDAVGRLRDGRLGLLVVEADERGVAAVAHRIAQPPLSADGTRTAGPLVGTAWYPTAGRDFASLVSAALDDLHRHAAPLLDVAHLS